jgi:hypothetical protein
MSPRSVLHASGAVLLAGRRIPPSTSPRADGGTTPRAVSPTEQSPCTALDRASASPADCHAAPHAHAATSCAATASEPASGSLPPAHL